MNLAKGKRSIILHKLSRTANLIEIPTSLKSGPSVFGQMIVLLVIIAALTAPLIAPNNPTEIDIPNKLSPPNVQFPLGTDRLGRDLLSRVIYGAQTSLMIGIVSVSIAMTVGIVVGSSLGYVGGKLDLVGMRFIDAMLAFPSILLAIGIAAILGSGVTNAIIAIGIAYVPQFVRITRGSVLSIKEKDYVEAARTVGENGVQVVFRYVLPNAISPVIVLATLNIGAAILTSAGLSFLGLGAQTPTPDWGADLNEGRLLMREAWWVTAFPGMAIVLTVLGFNLIGDAIRDALDPRLKHE